MEVKPTQHATEPDGQVLLHGDQRGLVTDRQPLVILENVGEAGAVPLSQRAAGAPGTQQGGVELLAEPNLENKIKSTELEKEKKHTSKNTLNLNRSFTDKRFWWKLSLRLLVLQQSWQTQELRKVSI